MGIIDREYLAESYSVHDKIRRDLSLIISNDGFSFAIFNGNAELVGLRVYRLTTESKLQECLATINNDNLLKSIFTKVNIGFGGRPSVLVPEKLFDHRYPEAYLPAKDTDLKTSVFWIDEVASLSGRNIHMIESELKDQLSDYFPGANFKHRTTAFIEYISRTASEKAAPLIYVHVDHNLAYTFLFEEGKLKYSGDFEFKNPNDFLYFVLQVFQEYKLDPEKNHLSLSGMLDANSLIYDKLYRYIRNINWTVPGNELTMDGYIDIFPAHYDFELMAMQLCG